MKKLFSIFSLLFVLVTAGCTPDFVLDVADLPKEITINRNILESTIIAGSEEFLFTHISDGEGNMVEARYERNETTNTYYTVTTMDWLTVSCKKNAMGITISAAPNKTELDRTLYIGVSSNGETAEIKVTQTK